MIVRLAILSLGLLLSGLLVGATQAQAATTVTPEIIARTKARCTENLGALNRLHQTDAFLRNDRGELYRTISDKLMVPLNRRLASNQVDAGPLLTITAKYTQEYAKFFDAYVSYDNSMSKLLRIDCAREPVAFYNALLESREKRISLSKSNLAIKELVRQYGGAFTELRAAFDKDNV